MKTIKAIVFVLLAAVWLSRIVPTAPDNKGHWAYPRLFDGTVLQATYTPTTIRSIQGGTCTLTNATANNSPGTVITSTNVTYSTLVMGGLEAIDSNNQPAMYGRMVLTDATHVTCFRGAGVVGTLTMTFQVTEYLSNFIKNIQSSTISFADGGATSTASGALTAMVVAKSQLIHTGQSADSVSNSLASYATAVRLAITDTTHVTGTRNTAGGAAVTVGFTVLEWK